MQTTRPDIQAPPTGRFAPSPTGRMHAGNIFAALIAWLDVKSRGGRIVLRIEDLDAQRSKAGYSETLQRDLAYLGLPWDEGPYYQSTRSEAYEEALAVLGRKGLLYPCFCTRADLSAASAPHGGEKAVYPGTCRFLTEEEREERARSRSAAIRVMVPDEDIGLVDGLQGAFSQNLEKDCGDFILRRSDGGFAYQLAVVVDDASQGIGSVVRGVDLLESTPRQIYLQRLLGLEQPEYCHIPLFVDGTGRRLSKRNHDAGMEALSKRFKTPQELIGHIAGLAGLIPPGESASPEELAAVYSRDPLRNAICILWE